ncbi:MAG: Fe-S cluster protein [Nitrospirae bacterium GWC2_57_13]|jgi:hypothetical protein|nr:MAG: Fe-S cluster protein [Nitrospirae bacterium GWC2_57_13]HAR46221.1 Fe-S cluster protein [Nitrospiraceae bacterium]HAS52728.1 Fe-S cluster protein [Nitrospiraceae bacterium]
MPKLKTPLELYRLLPRSNCGDCGISTCLAFAAAVIKQEKSLADCLHLDQDIIARFEGNIERQVNIEGIREQTLKELKEKIRSTDIVSLAVQLGARSTGTTLVIKCLGKDFEIDGQGTVTSQCHTHAWFSIPLLHYILFSEGADPSGLWVPFRELEQGKTWNPLFERRCEQPLKFIADTHGELFEDLIRMFSGTSSHTTFNADVSVVLYPLPKVPILICYWKPEDDLQSRLHLFFDDRAEKNLPVESLFTLGTGIVRMLEQIMLRHTDGKTEFE